MRALPWKDLVPLTPAERAREVFLPLPWLALSLVSAHQGVHILALAAAFYFFLSGLRLVHDTFHGNLGLRRSQNDLILAVLSGLMLGSMHAVRLTHLQHHRHCLGDDDVEGRTATRTALGALATGVLFPIQLHAAALRLASPRQARWVCAELALTVLVIALALTSDFEVIRLHVGAMAFGQTLTGFFAVWTVHHDCDRWHQIARTLRNRVKSTIACNMFFHLEHHLYPRVPTCRLRRLAERLDGVAPDLARARVY